MGENGEMISDLAIIGDRRTAALVDRKGDILWYCPGRFDCPSLFAALLDPKLGAWRLDMPDVRPVHRSYLDDSGVLRTVLAAPQGEWTITDFMPIGPNAPEGLVCRLFSAPPTDVRVFLRPRPNYGRDRVVLKTAGNAVVINGRYNVHASCPLEVADGEVAFTLPAGRQGWAVLAERETDPPNSGEIERWLTATLAHWRRTFEGASYSGPYVREVAASLRALRLLTHEQTGGIVAAATTSLPEIPGGVANWDYRYVWLRDAGMIVSALTRLDGDLAEGERYLEFICSSRGSSPRYPVPVFSTLDYERAPEEETLDWAGYVGSRPVRIGNGARDQMQLDAFANVLLAAKLIYQRSERRPHWETVSAIADFLAEHWREPDHGIWEEPVTRQYTAGKVIVACGLGSIAEFSSDPGQAERWRTAVGEIRDFVSKECMTSTGAYAVYAGSEEVDVSAALFPVWAYTAPDTPEMLATMAALERDWSRKGLLYWRRLECSDSRKEGAFLAGTFWVAQYWIMRGDLERARRIFDAGLACANDLGLFAEEGDPQTGRMLGNFPQAFAHAAFIGAVIDLKAALEGEAGGEKA
ncbi:glycoside hydrolase family 15 protein [Chelativorans salis]|uniref:Glycoside hydrolase family 15 protein n=1 Tax=Chelativorans salis TaxID=2978478 RepID=A0ABT2LLG8_9HYPH|nr:glycoside hydrolase family 15 protein [Chelativorans sp. EGI FJ00035]MCT7374667.1 glycoside hydrolase family 15 protein [Chelativorans sp. EGI FJ00035]